MLVKVAGKNISDFEQISLLRKSLLAVCVCRRAVCYLGKKDQDDDFAVLYDIEL